MHPKELGELCRFCKEDLNLESVSIVSNGSKIRGNWLKQFGEHVDILAISCDSFDEVTNTLIGRGTGMHLKSLQKVKAWCDKYGVQLKVNSVICCHNVDEDMSDAIARLGPVRWKVFQCLLIEGENTGDGALRDATALTITDEQFRVFLKRHQSIKCMVPEDNNTMKDSYLILDEELRFLNCTSGSKKPSRSIRDVSVQCALQEAGFDVDMFVKRGGIYDWTRERQRAPIDIEDLIKSEQVLPGKTKQLHHGVCKEERQEGCGLQLGALTMGFIVCFLIAQWQVRSSKK